MFTALCLFRNMFNKAMGIEDHDFSNPSKTDTTSQMQNEGDFDR